MKFEVSSSELLKKLQMAAGVIVSNPVLPITESFLFELKGNNLKITATNVETTVITSAEVSGKEKGKLAVPAKIFLETLKALPEQPIIFQSNNDNFEIEIQSSYGRYNLAGVNGDDFPEIPSEDNVEKFSFPSLSLTSAITKTSFATSSDELRLAMTGVYMQLDYNKVLFVATDAHKLVKYTFGNINSDINGSIILPKKVLSLLKNSLPDHGDVEISFNKKNAFFTFQDTNVVSRLIDAKYPDYNAVIPVDNPNILTVDKKDFQNSLRRIGIYANKGTNQVVLNITDNSLTLTAKDLDFSNEANEQLSCRYDGDTMSMGFNSKIFVDLLSNIETDEAVLHLSVPSRAGILVPSEQEENEHLMMLVMPVLSGY
jgi:DNA polymerase-3 subunit beta